MKWIDLALTSIMVSLFVGILLDSSIVGKETFIGGSIMTAFLFLFALRTVLGFIKK